MDQEETPDIQTRPKNLTTPNENRERDGYLRLTKQKQDTHMNLGSKVNPGFALKGRLG